jgi:DNA invertase Pin-like site-specific DNA recombinase
MVYGYLKASKLNDIECFKSKNAADKVLCDLISEWGKSSNEQLKELLENLEAGDKVVIRSIEDFIICDKVKNSINIDDLLKLLHIIKDKNIMLTSIEDNIEDYLNEDGLKTTFLLTDVIKNMFNKARKMGRPSNFPKNFLSVYYKFRSKEVTEAKKYDAYKAAEELGINYKTFYSLVKEFER